MKTNTELIRRNDNDVLVTYKFEKADNEGNNPRQGIYDTEILSVTFSTNGINIISLLDEGEIEKLVEKLTYQ